MAQYVVVLSPHMGANNIKRPIVLKVCSTKKDALREQARLVRDWRRGLWTEHQSRLPRGYSAPLHTSDPRSYLLRYGSSRYTFGVLELGEQPVVPQ
jgi:hypothetical protein